LRLPEGTGRRTKESALTYPFQSPGSGVRALVHRSAVPGILWPAIPDNSGVLSLALQFQFNVSQWWSPGILREHQFTQIALLVEHAFRTAPFWREHLARAGYRAGMEVTPRWFFSLPVVGRTEAQSAGEAFFSNAVPPEHGTVHSKNTSGSTATPMECRSTDVSALFWGASTLRDTLWHGRDLSAKLAGIRVGYERGSHTSWSPQSYCAFQTGPAVSLDARTDIDAQLDWLVGERPEYLLSHASNLRALAQRFLERGMRLDSLREAKSFSESLPADLRDLVREAWGVKLVDIYTTNEVGYIALQCPHYEHYHVQAENVLVEVVDEAGAACPPGGIGRVLATPLNNFAMPLIRYDIGDYAEAGAACPCGRGLPVLTRIMGRSRNMLRLPGGGMHWPGVPMRALREIAPLRQFRMIQHSLTGIEVQMVTDRPLTGDEETALRNALHKRLGYPFDVRFTRMERIERGANYKFEDFVCRVT
jgi:phenylacetate-CoA ligase